MRTVNDVLDRKGRNVWTVQATQTVYEALEMLAAKDVGALLVCEGDQAVGMFSERDYARQVILKGKTSKDTLVSEVMSTPIIFARPNQRLEECMALMTERRIRHLPVEDRGQVVGLISIGDVVKAILEEKQFLIEQLEGYIATGGWAEITANTTPLGVRSR
ncbi:MAG: inosine-5-monophosphate dehydrogenase [Candidatus Binatia bacterium]|nr:MAG: inosine-5-monophosphate dehydrogenase [Candidatus Binatia bacterium]